MEHKSEISGRGGSAFTHMHSTETQHVFLLAAGASRQEQFDDFFKIAISKANDNVDAVEKLDIREMDGFGARHSLSAATWKGKTILFGGQDVVKEEVLNEMFVYHHEKGELE